MDPRKIHHRYIDNAAMAYDAQSSPLAGQPRWIDGNNILTSVKGYAERRPGFPAAFETFDVPTTFINVKRIIGWVKWGGPFFTIVNDVNAGASTSKIYYLRSTIDPSFVLLYTNATASPYDFVTFNDTLYFANGADMAKWAAALIALPVKWGVAFPTSAPVVTLTTIASGPSAAIGHKYVYCYRTAFGHISSPSPVSADTGPYTSKVPGITGIYSADPQVTAVQLFRNTDGGGNIFFQVPGEIVNVTGTGTWTWNPNALTGDYNTDAQLFATTAPPEGANDPPSGLRGVVEYANRLWGFREDELRFSNNEEQTTGVAEESFAPTNKFRFGLEITALQPVAEGLLVHCGGSRVFRIGGDSLDTFRVDPLFSHMGTRYNAATTLIGKAAVWLDTANLIRLSDGFQQQEVSLDIRPDIATIDQANAQMCYHSDGRYQWGILMDATAGKLRVFDLDRNQWMPPWTITGTAIGSVEVAAGVFKLLLAHSSGKILAMNYAAYNDNASPYPATLTLSLTDFTSKDTTGQLATLEYFMTETDATGPSDVLRMVDDDPDTGTFVSIFANVQSPALRNSGTNLVEKWYYDRVTSGRRASVRIDWPTVDANFKLYGFDLAGSDGQTAQQ